MNLKHKISNRFRKKVRLKYYQLIALILIVATFAFAIGRNSGITAISQEVRWQMGSPLRVIKNRITDLDEHAQIRFVEIQAGLDKPRRFYDSETIFLDREYFEHSLDSIRDALYKTEDFLELLEYR